MLLADARGMTVPWLVGSYEDRLQSIRRAGGGDAAALEEFLAATPDTTGASVEELAALKNEAGMVLLQMSPPPASLARRFLSLAADPLADPVWRDYCVQFLGLGYQKWSAADRKTIASFLIDVVQRQKGATGGTALIALCNNADAPEIGIQRVKDMALVVVKDASYGDGGRMSALQVCARLNVEAVLPEARVLVGSSETLRASALAAIGALGNRGDAGLLRMWAKSPDRSIRTPAVAALKRMEERSAEHVKRVGL
jgi:hypothetical protein